MAKYVEESMNERRYSYTEWGMLLGLFVGSGLAIVLFAATGKATYFGIIGIGLALGLGLGAAFDGIKRSDQEDGSGPERASD
jgi:hypothetical protein